MNFLSLFVLIPVLMLGGLLLASDIKQIRAVCATGASLLLLLAVALTVLFLGERNSPAYSLRGKWNSCPGNTLCGFVC